MGLLDVATAYEKMLQNPENRKNTSGTLNQETPSLTEAQSGVGSAKPRPKTIEDADDRWMKELDKRMERKQQLEEGTRGKGLTDKQMGDARHKIIVKELKEIKKMMKMVMDVNLKVLKGK